MNVTGYTWAKKTKTAQLVAELSGKKPSKYRNKRVEVDGLKFDSKAEAKRWGELQKLVKAHEITALERQKRYPLRVNDDLVTTYVADFVYRDARSGMFVIEDTKPRGFLTPGFKVKRKLFEAIHKPLKITIVEMG